jgi:predicted RNA-binding protein with RPS1 domain
MSFVVKYGVAFRSNEKGAVKIRGIFAGYITTCNGQIELGSLVEVFVMVFRDAVT